VNKVFGWMGSTHKRTSEAGQRKKERKKGRSTIDEVPHCVFKWRTSADSCLKDTSERLMRVSSDALPFAPGAELEVLPALPCS
jgi:hypothetical protein